MKNINSYILAAFSIMYYMIFFQLIEIIGEIFILFYAKNNIDKVWIVVSETIGFIVFIFILLKVFMRLMKLMNLKILSLIIILTIIVPFFKIWLISFLLNLYNFNSENLLSLKAFTKAWLVIADYLFVIFLFFHILYNQNKKLSKEKHTPFITVFSIVFYMTFVEVSKIIGKIYLYIFKINTDIKILIIISVLVSLLILVFVSWRIFKKHMKFINYKKVILFFIISVFLFALQSPFSLLLEAKTINNYNISEYLSFYGIIKSIEFVVFRLYILLFVFEIVRIKRRISKLVR